MRLQGEGPCGQRTGAGAERSGRSLRLRWVGHSISGSRQPARGSSRPAAQRHPPKLRSGPGSSPEQGREGCASTTGSSRAAASWRPPETPPEDAGAKPGLIPAPGTWWGERRDRGGESGPGRRLPPPSSRCDCGASAVTPRDASLGWSSSVGPLRPAADSEDGGMAVLLESS